MGLLNQQVDINTLRHEYLRILHDGMRVILASRPYANHQDMVDGFNTLVRERLVSTGRQLVPLNWIVGANEILATLSAPSGPSEDDYDPEYDYRDPEF